MAARERPGPLAGGSGASDNVVGRDNAEDATTARKLQAQLPALWERYRVAALAYIARPTGAAKAARDSEFSAFAAAYAPEATGLGGAA